MEIRTALPGEGAQVVCLINELIVELGGPMLPVDEAISTTESFVADEHDGEIIVASQGAELVAVCTITYQPSIRTFGKYGIIQEMYVVPKFRSANLGAQIIEKAISQAKSVGCPIVELSTPPDGARAEHFYRSVGFDQVGIRMRSKL